MGLDWTGLGTWANDIGEDGAKLLGKSGLNFILFYYYYFFFFAENIPTIFFS